MYNRRVTIKGIVQEGCGKGAMYVRKPFYFSLLRSLLRTEPFPGTLNIRMLEPVDDYIALSSLCPPSLRLETLKSYSEMYGGLIVWFGKIDDEQCLVIRPLLSHHNLNIIEIIAAKNLRELLGLLNGSEVTFAIYCST